MADLLSWGKGYRVDAESGTVFGLRGSPIRQRNPQGYVFISSHGRYVASAHRVVWEAANGPIPAGLEINHINGVKGDNRLSNLELVTRSENCLHASRLGLSDYRGEKNGRYIDGRCMGRKRPARGA